MKNKTKIFAALLFLLLPSSRGVAEESIFDTSKSYENGKEIDTYSTKYTNEQELLSRGGCQLISVKGKNEIERILTTDSPFAPRDDPDWTAKEGVPPNPKRCFLTKHKDFTFLCGKEQFKYLNKIKAWQNLAGGSGGAARRVQALGRKKELSGGLNADYEYYNLPIEKKGKILATKERKIAFDILMNAIYQPCYRALLHADVPESIANEICCNVAQYTSCRVNILPPVEPTNKLKMSYGFFQNKSQPPVSTSPGSKDTNDQLPRITDSSRDSYPKLLDKGLGFYSSLEPEQFGYNMPPLTYWSTGDVASKALVDKSIKRKKWEPWRQVIAGVNSYYKPDESNPTESGVFNKSAQFGQWSELIQYQARCQQIFGLNCICDYFRNFYPGTSLAYALSRYDTNISLAATPSFHDERQTINGKELVKRVEDSPRIHWTYEVGVLRGKNKFPAILGFKMENGETWPGSGEWLITGGLSKAEKGDIIFIGGDSYDAAANRPWHAAFVEKREANGCIEISEQNNGVQRDIAGNTENWGRTSIRHLCPTSENVSSAVEEGGADSLKPCTYVEYGYCHETDWSKWKIYRPRKVNPNKGPFDPEYINVDTRPHYRFDGGGSSSGDCGTTTTNIAIAINQIRFQNPPPTQAQYDKIINDVQAAKNKGCNPPVDFWQQYPTKGVGDRIVAPDLVPLSKKYEPTTPPPKDLDVTGGDADGSFFNYKGFLGGIFNIILPKQKSTVGVNVNVNVKIGGNNNGIKPRPKPQPKPATPPANNTGIRPKPTPRPKPAAPTGNRAPLAPQPTPTAPAATL